MQMICQSCGMPMHSDEQKGSNADGSKSEEYCVFCYKDGEFTDDISKEEFIEKQVRIAMEKMHRTEAEAREMAEMILPNLKRWKVAE